MNWPLRVDAVAYCVPVGVCTATIVAPMIGWPSVSATRPLMLDVVTCAEAVQNANSDKNKKASFLISISLD
ncbi:hypothetical protein [Alistipes communis]|uniref:hypothetical protein n=1 Tax=Alistipes communis TaxID=2585118 RepID=UPI003A85C4FD